jgi:hypothetical protein
MALPSHTRVRYPSRKLAVRSTATSRRRTPDTPRGVHPRRMLTHCCPCCDAVFRLINIDIRGCQMTRQREERTRRRKSRSVNVQRVEAAHAHVRLLSTCDGRQAARA